MEAQSSSITKNESTNADKRKTLSKKMEKIAEGTSYDNEHDVATPAMAHSQKYYMNFDFYFKRTSFRTMTLYFKTVFKPFFETWKSSKKNNTSVHVPLLEFA